MFRKAKMKLVFKKNCRKAFTLIEVTVALIVLGMIAATVLVIINRAMDTVVLWQNKMQAFEIARENMEKILSQPTVTDIVEYGASETNPDITWETTVESFYEPVTNNMWMRAVCDAKFVDSEGQEQKIELTHWLTSLSKDQIEKILEQRQRESEYQATMGEPSEDVGQQGRLSSGQQAKRLLADQMQQHADQMQQQAEQKQQEAKQKQQQAKQMQQQAEQMPQQQAEQMRQQAEQMQQQAEQAQQQAKQAQQQAEQMQQQADQMQQQADQSQQDTDKDSAWKEVEKYIGPPPAGYNSWKDVPSDDFWVAMMKWFRKK